MTHNLKHGVIIEDVRDIGLSFNIKEQSFDYFSLYNVGKDFYFAPKTAIKITDFKSFEEDFLKVKEVVNQIKKLWE